MTTISKLPILYRIDGIPRGKRTARSYVASECVPVEIEAIRDPGRAIEIGPVHGIVGEGRLWIPVSTRTSETLDEIDLAARSELLLHETEREHGSVLGVFAPAADARMTTSLAKISIEREGDLSRIFSRFEWTDRDSNVRRAVKAATRLRTFDGKIWTDRLEPVYAPRGFVMEDAAFVASIRLVDVETHERYRIGDDPRRLVHEKNAWTFLPPPSGMIDDVEDWQTDVHVGCAAYLADELSSHLAQHHAGPMVKRGITLCDAAPYEASAAYAEVATLRRRLRDERPVAIDGIRISSVIDRLRSVREVVDPILADAVERTLDVLDEVERVMDLAARRKCLPAVDLDGVDLEAMLGMAPR